MSEIFKWNKYAKQAKQVMKQTDCKPVYERKVEMAIISQCE